MFCLVFGCLSFRPFSGKVFEFAEVAPKTAEKKSARHSLPAGTVSAKTPAKELQAEAVAQNRVRSYRSAVKPRTPAKPEVEFDAAATFAEVAPKTGLMAAIKKAPRRKKGAEKHAYLSRSGGNGKRI